MPIFWRSWAPAAPERAACVVVVVHGAGEHGGRYEHVAARLVKSCGAAVFAADHRGHGRSGGPRALLGCLDDVVFDLGLVVDLARAEFGGLPVFMLGHSMGALIALRWALASGGFGDLLGLSPSEAPNSRLHGLVLSGTLAATDAPAWLRVVGRAVARVLPRLPLIRIDTSTLSRDPAVVAGYESDALVHHRPLPARTAAVLAEAVDALPETVGEIRVPALVLYGSDDRLCPPAGSEMLGRRLGAADLTVRRYDGLRHEILNEPERDAVLDEVCAWVAARLPADSGVS